MFFGEVPLVKVSLQGLNITLLASGDEKQPAATDFEVAQFRGKTADFKTEWRWRTSCSRVEFHSPVVCSQTHLKRTVHFWTKPAAIVSCAVHYGMRKCLLTVCSLAWQVADKLEVMRRCGASEIWWLAMRLRRLQCIDTLFSSRICASFSKVIYCLKLYIQTM